MNPSITRILRYPGRVSVVDAAPTRHWSPPPVLFDASARQQARTFSAANDRPIVSIIRSDRTR